MEKKWKLVNAENVKPYVCDEVYSSKMLTGDEMAGQQVININEGTLIAGAKTEGGVHEETEIYYIVDGNGDVWLDEDKISVKPGDIIIIPGGVFHWIDNTKSDRIFKLFTFWPRQELNGVFFERFKEWNTSVRYVDKDYTMKRMGDK